MRGIRAGRDRWRRLSTWTSRCERLRPPTRDLPAVDVGHAGRLPPPPPGRGSPRRHPGRSTSTATSSPPAPSVRSSRCGPGCMLAAVPDVRPTLADGDAIPGLRRARVCHPDQPYFNSGVMVVDLTAMAGPGDPAALRRVPHRADRTRPLLGPGCAQRGLAGGWTRLPPTFNAVCVDPFAEAPPRWAGEDSPGRSWLAGRRSGRRPRLSTCGPDEAVAPELPAIGVTGHVPGRGRGARPARGVR